MSNDLGVQRQAGDIILDLYKVTSILDQGEFGEVYRVRHLGWDVDLILKSLKPGAIALESGEAVEKRLEPWVQMGLHPHVVTCYYVRSVNNIPLMFTEYVVGDSLDEWIGNRQLYREGMLVALSRILDIAIQFAWGLHAAHAQGAIHGAVRPEVALITPDGVVKVTDFGLAALKPFNSGSAASQAETSISADLTGWALSVLAMFTEEFSERSSPDALQHLEQYLAQISADPQPSMPLAIVELLRHCFQPNTADRPASLQSVARQLQQIYQQITGSPYPRREPYPASYAADRLNNRALALIDLGQQAEALQHWGQALAAEPQHFESAYNQGLVLWRTGKLDDSSLLRQLEEHRPTTPDWKVDYRFSLIHLERNDPQTALQQLEQIRAGGVQSELLEDTLDRLRQTTRSSLPVELGERGSGNRRLTAAALSPDSRYALSASEDKMIRLWEVNTGRYLCGFTGHADKVTTVSFNPSGSYILSSSLDKTLKLWGITATSHLHDFKGHRGAVLSAVFSPDGTAILSGSQDWTVRLWEVATGKCQRVYKGHRAPVSGLAFSPDGRSFLSSGEWRLKQWDVRTGRITRVFEDYQGNILCLAYSPDGRSIVSGGSSMYIWDSETGRIIRVLEGHQQSVTTIAFTPDGRYILSGSEDKQVKLWEVSSGRCIRTFAGHETSIQAVAVDAEGRCAISADLEHLRLWQLNGLDQNSQTPPYLAPLCVSQVQTPSTVISSDLLFEQELAQAQTAQEQGDAISAAQHVRKARSLHGYGRADVALQAWFNLYTRLPRQKFAGCWETASFDRHLDAVQAVVFSPDSYYALSASADRTLKLWDVVTSRCLRSLEGHQDSVTAIGYAHERYALSGSADRSLKLWDVATGACLQTFRGHTEAVTAVAISPDGEYALSGSVDCSLKLWEVSTGRCLRSRDAHKAPIQAVALTSEGSYALSGSADGTLKLWDMPTGACLRTFEGHAAAVQTAVFSLDDRFLLSGGADKTLKLWAVGTGECVRTLVGHTAAVCSVGFSADGKSILSGSDDCTLKLWATETGECLQTLEGHRAAIRSVAFSPTGNYILSASLDRTCKLWTVDWELADRQPTYWDEGAKPYLEAFLRLHTPRPALLPAHRLPTEEEIVSGLMRHGSPSWTESDFQALMRTLGYAGYGWLQAQGVRQQLLSMTEPSVKPAAKPEVKANLEVRANLETSATAFATAFATVFADPSSTTTKVVLTITEGSLKEQVFEFSDRTTWVIGRAKDCNLQLPNDKQHETISRYHCMLDINPPAIRIRDLGSLHGTYVNGQVIGRRQPNQTPEQVAQANFPEHDLVAGDEVQLGKTVFRVSIEGAPLEEPATRFSTDTALLDRTVIGHPVSASTNGSSATEEPAISIAGYTILRSLGQGTCGEVYLARNQTDTRVALKVMLPKATVRMPLIDLFLREVENTRGLQHPHIVPLLDSGYSNGAFFFAFEYCEGGSITDLMHQQGGQLSVDQAVPIVLQVLDGLEYAHTVDLTPAESTAATPQSVAPSATGSTRRETEARFVHRDLKPTNLLLTRVQGTRIAKIADYGLAKAFDQAGLSGLSISSSVPLFMSRQQAVNFNYAQPEIDVWACAACLYYMLTGSPPRDFGGKDPYLVLLQTVPVPILQRNPAIPKPLADLIDTALLDNPEIIFKKAAAFKRALIDVI